MIYWPLLRWRRVFFHRRAFRRRRASLCLWRGEIRDSEGNSHCD